MNNFIYYTPTKVFFGRGEENNVGKIIKSYGIKKVLLHYGSGSIKENGIYDRVISKLNEEKISFVELSGVSPNPKLSLVKKGIELAREFEAELILAVGGGSVIDSAKAIADGFYDDGDIWDFWKKIRTPKKALPVGTILTLSAAGSEMSDSCVITNEDTKEKRGFSNELHRCLFSIMNPELTYTVSKFQTGCGIVDIMMHTLERYFSVNDNTPITDEFGLGLLRSVVESGRIVIDNPNDYISRANLMWCSSLSHNSITGCGKEYYMPVHQIEHELSGMFDNIAHGAGLSVLFPAWAKVVYKSDIARFKRFALEVMHVKDTGDDDLTAYNGILALEKFYKSIEMPTRLSELGVYEDSFEALARNYTFQGTRTIPDRVLVDYDKCLEILKEAK